GDRARAGGAREGVRGRAPHQGRAGGLSRRQRRALPARREGGPHQGPPQRLRHRWTLRRGRARGAARLHRRHRLRPPERPRNAPGPRPGPPPGRDRLSGRGPGLTFFAQKAARGLTALASKTRRRRIHEASTPGAGGLKPCRAPARREKFMSRIPASALLAPAVLVLALAAPAGASAETRNLSGFTHVAASAGTDVEVVVGP